MRANLHGLSLAANPHLHYRARPMMQELEEYRRRIDALDDQLIALLQERMGIVTQVGELKQRNGCPPCPIRPGREASMVRRIAAQCQNGLLSPLAATALWRTVIGSSTTLEAPLTLSIYATDENPQLLWLAREYFGPLVQIQRQPHVKRVIGDVMDGSALVGVIPLPTADDDGWWRHLLSHAPDAPKIFAHLPFVFTQDQERQWPRALAIANIAPEASGDDQTLIVLVTTHNISQHKLQSELTKIGLPAQWLAITHDSPHERHHLIACAGFVDEHHSGLNELRKQLGDQVHGCYFLGSYATPMVLT